MKNSTHDRLYIILALAVAAVLIAITVYTQPTQIEIADAPSNPEPVIVHCSFEPAVLSSEPLVRLKNDPVRRPVESSPEVPAIRRTTAADGPAAALEISVTENGRAAENANITLFFEDARFSLRRSVASHLKSGAAGFAQFHSKERGTIYYKIESPSGGFALGGPIPFDPSIPTPRLKVILYTNGVLRYHLIDRLGFVVPNRRIFIYGDEAFNRFYWESDRGLLRTNAEGDGMFILPQGNYRLRVARHGHDYSGGGCNSTHFCDAFPCAATPDRFITIRAGETSFLDDTCPALVAPKFCLSTNGVERHETHVELAMSADYNKSEFRWNWGNNDSIKIEEGNYDVILYDSPAEGIALNFRANDVSLLSGCPYFSFDLRCGKVRIAPGSLGKFVRGEQIQLFWNSGARSCTLTMVAPNTDEFEIPFAPEGTSRIVVYRGGVQSTVFATVRPNELINVSF